MEASRSEFVLSLVTLNESGKCMQMIIKGRVVKESNKVFQNRTFAAACLQVVVGKN